MHPRMGGANPGASYRIYLNQNAQLGDISTDADEENVSEEVELDSDERTSKSKSFWWGPELSTDGANKLLKIIMSGSGVKFDYPKPIQLVERILAIGANKDSLILDSFAGSGTTAHAVLDANTRDGGNRRFILVEMEDYADRLTAERVRRVMNGYPYTGTQRTELLRERLNWRAIENAAETVHRVQGIENLHGHEYNRIRKEVKDGELIVTGERAVAERAEGLGGTFTYCTLGEPVELDRILTGEDLPSFDALAGVLFHMATAQPLDPAQMNQGRAYVGQSGGAHVWLIYRPDLDWLKSPEAALSLSFARTIATAHPGDRHLVFAPARHVSQQMLNIEGLAVEFLPLPFALYRVERV